MRTWTLLLIMLLFVPRTSLGQERTEVRDPFRSKLAAQSESASPLQGPPSAGSAELQGISIGPTGSFAVVSGEVYREGEEKGAVKVTQIRKKEVDIVVSGVPKTLRMIPDELRPPTKGSGASPSSAEVAEQPEEAQAAKEAVL